jgi:hypothetical protein
METYRDHPLAFLCGRASVTTMRFRAEDWRKRKHDAQGIDVAGIFERVASNMDDVKSAFGTVLEMVRAEVDIDDVVEACENIRVDFATAEEAIEAAQFMRTRNLDPYGGSVCATLEMAWEELRLYGECIESAISLAETTRSHDAVEAIVLEALDLVEEPQATHEAPRALM